MKKFVFCILLMSFFVLGTSLAWAGRGEGNVTQIISIESGVVLVQMSASSMIDPIACNTASRFAINTNTAGGRSMYALVLALYLAGKPVGIQGRGDCAFWGDSESIYFPYSLD